MASVKRVVKDKNGVPIWAAQYRRTPNGKNIHRRIHAHTRQEVERIIALDSNTPGLNLKWSEGLQIYLDAKKSERRQSGHLVNVAHAARVFMETMGDIAIEATTPELFKTFMQAVVSQPVKHPKSGKVLRESGPKVANHHRKELITIARYLLKHAGKITNIPFKDVPTLPVVTEQRRPIAKGKVPEYLDALPEHIRRPVLLILLYGLRSTAVCNITIADVSANTVRALDKNNNLWDIPIDEMLRGIIADAMAYREQQNTKSDRLLVNGHGRAWNRTTLLKAAQKAWDAAGLERKKIHEIRHTLGTLAGKSFTPLMVQAAMRHKSRKSSEAYSHPNEEMAAEVREKLVAELFQNHTKTPDNDVYRAIITHDKEGVFPCPFCNHNLLILREKGQCDRAMPVREKERSNPNRKRD